jgi:hypothetical protein
MSKSELLVSIQFSIKRVKGLIPAAADFKEKFINRIDNKTP